MKKWKILIPSLVATASMPFISLVGCNKKPSVSIRLTLSETSISMKNGQTHTLEATLEPEGTTSELEWSSSNKNVATVDNGIVTGVNGGNATITVKAVDFEGVEATCDVRVIDFLTVTALEDSTFLTYDKSKDSTNLSYSIDGSDWTQHTLVQEDFSTSVPLSKGSTMKIKGLNPEGFGSRLLFTGKVALSGTIMSLIDDGQFTTDIPCSKCFYGTFWVGGDSAFSAYHNSVVSAEDLILPDTDLTSANNCYEMMFSGCYKLEKGPRLPATVLSTNCYGCLFYNCKSLKEIKLDFTGNFGNTYFSSWVSSVPQTNGIFYYNGDDVNNFGVSAIPGTTDSHWEVRTFED